MLKTIIPTPLSISFFAALLASFSPGLAWGQAQAITDPLYQSKGDQKRTYKFAPTGEMLPYRIYVPTTWKQGAALPLVVVLHGGGLTDDAPFERTPLPMKNELQTLAEQYNFIVVSPSGFNDFAAFVAGHGLSSSGVPQGGLPGGMPRPPGQPVPVFKGNDLNPRRASTANRT